MITIYLKQYNKIIRNADTDLFDDLGFDDILWIDMVQPTIKEQKAVENFMEISLQTKQQVEEIYARQGLSFTDAVNIFIQQSPNMEGLPFLASPENEEYMKAKAMRRLMAEVQKGWDSAERDGWVSEEDAYRLLGIDE